MSCVDIRAMLLERRRWPIRREGGERKSEEII